MSCGLANDGLTTALLALDSGGCDAGVMGRSTVLVPDACMDGGMGERA